MDIKNGKCIKYRSLNHEMNKNKLDNHKCLFDF